MSSYRKITHSIQKSTASCLSVATLVCTYTILFTPTVPVIHAQLTGIQLPSDQAYQGWYQSVLCWLDVNNCQDEEVESEYFYDEEASSEYSDATENSPSITY